MCRPGSKRTFWFAVLLSMAMLMTARAVHADDVAAYLEQHGLKQLLAVHLEQQLASADAAARSEILHRLANLYAAMPSLHVGWSVWVAIALITVLRSPWRYLAILYPCTMTFVVIGTANHYVLDAVAGAAYAIACFWLARWIYARQQARRAARAPQTTPDLIEA